MGWLVRLYRQENSWQQIVTISSRFRWHRHKQRIGEGGFSNNLEINVSRCNRIASDETLSKLTPDGSRITPVEGLLGGVEAGRVDIVLHIVALQMHLDS